MKYAKIMNNEITKFPYSWEDLKAANEFTTFDNRFGLIEWFNKTTESEVDDSYIVEIIEITMPVIDHSIQNIIKETQPKLVEGIWLLDWIITDKTSEEISIYQEMEEAVNL